MNRTQVMGVVNVTPDSFVGEVRTPDHESALRRCQQLIAEGADVVDIGGESTRPGATPIGVEEELARVLPVVADVSAWTQDVRISIDTRHAEVAQAAVEAGASMINDMSATLGPLAGQLGVEYVAAHMQGSPETMQHAPSYEDVIGEVLDQMVQAAQLAVDAGSPEVLIDPGIGFGKTQEHNLALLAHIDRFSETGFGVLIGVSRKGLTGRIHAASDQGVAFGTVGPVATDDRLEASLALAAWGSLLGVSMVRVHDVGATVQALKVVASRFSV